MSKPLRTTKEVWNLTVAAPDLLKGLERMLLEFDFMVEQGVIPDVRNDIIFVQARAAVAKAKGEVKGAA
jgi:hypothetical protein